MYKWLLVLLIIPTLLSSCNLFDDGQLNNVGLLLEGTIHDESWGRGAYLGLLNIKEEQNVSVLFRENIDTERKAEEAVEDFKRQGVNLVFGHGSNFGRVFDSFNEYYPDIQFVYFNGRTFDRNITSINFDGYEVGYFAGMVAGEMTDTQKIGVVSAFQYQDEVEGFFEGVQAVDPTIDMDIRVVNSRYDQQRAIMFFNELVDEGVDVVFPAGDGFNTPVIRAAQEEGIYAIGFIDDQYDIAPKTVLTSTVHKVDGLYTEIATQFNEDNLPSGIVNITFDQNYLTIGNFGDDVSLPIQTHVEEKIAEFEETGQLPK
ncbi:BMP family ABC transporter substrate-binding protein [Alkalibacillus aidingensis]|uniref:BMP family ABC transporter substrate-binding protein n=1 Tax=Alkalibacillus aidingensis TaxID=2747607 RepID=UPI001660EC1D|nr:BMP family ABC transporter substrate-binding protein [Alkalibacillus aidingensis]